MAIVAKNKNITEDIVDKNGVVLGKISYNPDDTSAYTKMCNIINSITELNNKFKEINNIKDLPKAELKSMDEFEKYRESFDKINEILHFQDEKIEEIIKETDSIFGVGTCNILMNGSHDVELLMPLLDAVLPEFKKARNNKMSKYIDKKQYSDVME